MQNRAKPRREGDITIVNEKHDTTIVRKKYVYTNGNWVDMGAATPEEIAAYEARQAAREARRVTSVDTNDDPSRTAASAAEPAAGLRWNRLYDRTFRGAPTSFASAIPHDPAIPPASMMINPIFREHDTADPTDRTPLLASVATATQQPPIQAAAAPVDLQRVANTIYTPGAALSRTQRAVASFYLSCNALWQFVIKNGFPLITFALMMFLLLERLSLNLREETLYIQDNENPFQFFGTQAIIANSALFLHLLVPRMRLSTLNLLNTAPNLAFCGDYRQITRTAQLHALAVRIMETINWAADPASPVCPGPGYNPIANNTGPFPHTVNNLRTGSGHEVTWANGITAVLSLFLFTAAIALYRNPTAADAQERIFTGLANLLGITLQKTLEYSRALLLDLPGYWLSCCAPEQMSHLKAWLNNFYNRSTKNASDRYFGNNRNAIIAEGLPRPLSWFNLPFYQHLSLLERSYRDTAGNTRNHGEYLVQLFRTREADLKRAAKASLEEGGSTQFSELTAFDHIDQTPFNSLLAAMRGHNPANHRLPEIRHRSLEEKINTFIEGRAATLAADDPAARDYREALRQQAYRTLNAYQRERLMELIVKHLEHTWERLPLASSQTRDAAREQQLTNFYEWMQRHFPVLLALLMTEGWENTLGYLVPSPLERKSLVILSKFGLASGSWLRYFQVISRHHTFVSVTPAVQQHRQGTVRVLGFLYTGQASVANTSRRRPLPALPAPTTTHVYEQAGSPRPEPTLAESRIDGFNTNYFDTRPVPDGHSQQQPGLYNIIDSQQPHNTYLDRQPDEEDDMYMEVAREAGLPRQAIGQIVYALANAGHEDEDIYEILEAISRVSGRARQPLPGEEEEENIYETPVPLTPQRSLPKQNLVDTDYETLQVLRRQQNITVTWDANGRPIATQQYSGSPPRVLIAEIRIGEQNQSVFDIGQGDRLFIYFQQPQPRYHQNVEPLPNDVNPTGNPPATQPAAEAGKHEDDDDTDTNDDAEAAEAAALPPPPRRHRPAQPVAAAAAFSDVQLRQTALARDEARGSMKQRFLCDKLFSEQSVQMATVLLEGNPSQDMDIELKRQRGLNRACYEGESFDQIYAQLLRAHREPVIHLQALTDAHWSLLIKFGGHLSQQNPATQIDGAIAAIKHYAALFQTGNPRKDTLDDFIRDNLQPIKQQLVALLFQCEIPDELRSYAIKALVHCIKHDNNKDLAASFAAMRTHGLHAAASSGKIPAADDRTAEQLAADSVGHAPNPTN